MRIASDTNVSSEATFDNCRFMINYNGALPVAASGYMLTASVHTVTDTSTRKVVVRNCYFDHRADKNIECYRNGTWELINNKYSSSATGHAVYFRGYNAYRIDVTINGGDCTNVLGDFLNGYMSVAPDQVTTIAKLNLIGDFVGTKSSALSSTGNFTVATGTYSARRLMLAALPTDGLIGDIVTIYGALS